QRDALGVVQIVQTWGTNRAVVAGTDQQLAVPERAAQPELVGVVVARSLVVRIAVAQRGIEAVERTVAAHVDRQRGFEEEVAHAVGRVHREAGGTGTGEVARGGIGVVFGVVGVVPALHTDSQADLFAIGGGEAEAQVAVGFSGKRAIAGLVD